MAYNGFLIKVRNKSGSSYDEPPMHLVHSESYKITPNQRLDLDSGMTSTDGFLHRSVLNHTRSKIEFETMSISNDDADSLIAFFRDRWITRLQRDVYLEYYDTETNSYKTGRFYMPDIDMNIDHVDNAKNKVFYKPIRLAFIEY